jgi:chromosome segregation ATPase
VLGVVGLIVLTAMVYSKRHAWAYVNYRYDLLMGGLPLDKDERDADGKPLERNLGDQTLKDLFPTNPVHTQEEEVRRVKGELDSKITQAGEQPSEQIPELARFLLPLANTNAQRERLIACRTHLKDKTAIDELKKQLGAAVRPAVGTFVRLNPYKETVDKLLEEAAFQRAFLAAFRSAVQELRDSAFAESFPKDRLAVKILQIEPKGPFEEAFVKALFKEPKNYEKAFKDTKKVFDDAKKTRDDARQALRVAQNARADKPLDAAALQKVVEAERKLAEAERTGTEAERKAAEAFVRAVYGSSDKPMDKLVDEAFEEAVESVRKGLQEEFNEAFAAALEGKRVPADRNTADGRRETIAHLLFSLVDEEAPEKGQLLIDQPGYKRVLTVIGLAAFNREITAQAQRLARITRELERSMIAERTNFLGKHEEVLALVQQRAREVEKLEGEVKRTNAQIDQAAGLLAEKKKDVKEYEDELAKVRKQTDDNLKELRTMSDSLFKVRIQARDATKLNQDYVEEIRKLEKPR